MTKNKRQKVFVTNNMKLKETITVLLVLFVENPTTIVLFECSPKICFQDIWQSLKVSYVINKRAKMTHLWKQ